MVIIGFTIKIFKLGLIILNICYFLGLFWFIFCDVANDFHDQAWAKNDWGSLPPEELAKMNTEFFLEFYDLENNTPY